MKTVYVVTDIAIGWDCVLAVFSNREAANKYKKGRDNIVITRCRLKDECNND